MPSHMKSGDPVLHIESSWDSLIKSRDFNVWVINNSLKAYLEPRISDPDIDLRSRLVQLIGSLFSEENRGRFGVEHQEAYNFIM
jgi:hypothetical protein